MQINPQTAPEMTQELTFLKGQFHLWRFRIPYFSTVVTLRFARERFTLIEELASSATVDWKIEELFQREIDWERIDSELVGYLRDESKPQFFNALIVALLPKESDTFAADYKVGGPYKRMEDTVLEDPLHVGGIQIQYYRDSAQLAGKLRWDVKTIVAVAVDGQHRLAALKEFQAPPDLDATLLPVIVLIPHPSVGLLQPPTPIGTPTLQSTLRQVFTDINKHARIIPKPRQILLDDQDVHRVCVRKLIGQQLTDTPEDGRVPLSLVDWVSEKNRIDSGPFLTTVLLLELMMREVLREVRVRGTFDSEEDEGSLEDEVASVMDWVAETFEPGDADRDSLKSQVTRSLESAMRLTWLPEHIRIFETLFETNWRPHLIRIFAEVEPYKKLWSFSHQCGLLRPEFIHLYIAREVQKGARARQRADEIEMEMRKRDATWSRLENYEKPLAEIDKGIKQDSWAFTVVFQRAMFRCYSTLLRQRPLFISDKKKDPRAAFTTFWIDSMNALFAKGLGSTTYSFSRPLQPFWQGIGKKLGDVIDFSNSGCERLQRWLSAWLCMLRMKDVPSRSQLVDTKDDLGRMLGRLLGHGVVLRGFEAPAASELRVNATDDSKRNKAEELLDKRYEHLRTTVAEIK